MQSSALTPNDYLAALPEDKQKVVAKLRQVVLDNLPKGFQETMGYGMLCYSVPHSIYPKGYHCDPKLPLMFVSLASQKNFCLSFFLLLSSYLFNTFSYQVIHCSTVTLVSNCPINSNGISSIFLNRIQLFPISSFVIQHC